MRFCFRTDMLLLNLHVIPHIIFKFFYILAVKVEGLFKITIEIFFFLHSNFNVLILIA